MTNILDLWSEVISEAGKDVDFVIRLNYSVEGLETIVREDDHYMLVWEEDFKNKLVMLSNIQSIWVLQMVLRQVAMYLLQGKGFMLHGSGVVDTRSQLHVFLAKSGGGKSTTAKWLVTKGLSFVADDSIIAVRMGEVWRCYGPSIVEKEHKPVNIQSHSFRIYCLHKAKKIRKTISKSRAASMQAILKQLWTVTGLIDKKTYDLVVDFVKESPIYNLSLPLAAENLLEVLNEN